MHAFQDTPGGGISPEGQVELDESVLDKIAGGMEMASKKDGASSKPPAAAPTAEAGSSKKKETTGGTTGVEGTEATLPPSTTDGKKPG